jgi:predicted enzyme related to lactoylglutathione lyase
MQIDAYEHGVPSWVDVTSKDFEVSQKFYSDMFGWQIERGPDEFGGYSMAVLNGRMVAGVSPAMAPEAPSVWSTYVDVASVDDTLAKATAAGGTTIAGPMDVGEAGRMAVFSDPDGAVIGLWQPGEHKGAGLVNEPGTWTWSELLCDDPEREKAFYTGVFGWGTVTHGEGAGAYTEWQVGDRSIGGMMQKPAEMPAGSPSYWVVYIAVEDIGEAAKRLEGLGGSIIVPTVEIDQGSFAVVADPVGAIFNLFQQKS